MVVAGVVGRAARDGVGELAALESDVTLALLLEADADVVANELVAKGAADAGDAELEPDLLQGRGVAGFEALVDELPHLLLRDPLRVDAISDLQRRQSRVGNTVGDV